MFMVIFFILLAQNEKRQSLYFDKVSTA